MRVLRSFLFNLYIYKNIFPVVSKLKSNVVRRNILRNARQFETCMKQGPVCMRNTVAFVLEFFEVIHVLIKS